MEPLKPGTRIGPHELVAPIGAGGMGEVWKARDTRLDRTVAIKFSHAAFSDRFQREARAIAALNHPNIATLHDVGENYLVMEYVEGKRLTGPMPLAEALALAVEITEALDAAHKKGIVHRDLKPANILVTKSGIKLLDFGLAKHSPSVLPRSDATLTQGVTEAGTIVGTLNYMSPEQAEATEVDHRSDIFSFGCVLYELITGKKAFDGRSRASVIASILTADPVPLAAAQPLAPPALERVIKRCLAKDPDERWQSARDLCEELKWIAESGLDLPTSAARRGRKSMAAVIASAAIGIGALAAALWLWGSKAPQPTPQVVRFTVNAVDPNYPAISPDGRHIAYLGDRDQHLFVQDLDSDEPRSIAGTAGAQRPFWSPDSASIACAMRGELVKVPFAGGPPTLICSLPNPAFFSGSWGAGGEWIVFGSRGAGNKGGLYRVAARGGTASLIIADSPELTAPRDPYFLPLPDDQASFLFAASSLNEDVPARTWIHDLNTGKHHPLGAADGQFPTYSRSGHILYMRLQLGIQMWAAPFSLKTLKVTGEPFPVADSQFVFGVSSNDTLVYLERRRTMHQLAVRDRAGRKTGMIGAAAQDMRNPALSPDAARVAVSAADGTNRNVWIMEMDRPVKIPVTFARGETREFHDDPSWSPSGDRVAYYSAASGRYSVRSRPADGSKSDVELVTSPVPLSLLQWVEADRLLVTRFDNNSRWLEFLKIPVTRLDEDARGANAPPYSEHTARVSPDGRLLAFTSTQSGRGEVHVRPVSQSGGGIQVSEAGASQARWRHDGKELYYVEGNSIIAVTITSSPAAGVRIGKPQLLFTVESGLVNGYDVFPDGQRFLIPEPVEAAKPRGIRVVQNWSAAFAPKRANTQ